MRKKQDRLRKASVRSDVPNDLAEIRKGQNRIPTASVRSNELDNLAEKLKEQDRWRTDSVRACKTERFIRNITLCCTLRLRNFDLRELKFCLITKHF